MATFMLEAMKGVRKDEAIDMARAVLRRDRSEDCARSTVAISTAIIPD
jgi:hypothetical protein